MYTPTLLTTLLIAVAAALPKPPVKFHLSTQQTIDWNSPDRQITTIAERGGEKGGVERRMRWGMRMWA